MHMHTHRSVHIYGNSVCVWVQVSVYVWGGICGGSVCVYGVEVCGGVCVGGGCVGVCGCVSICVYVCVCLQSVGHIVHRMPTPCGREWTESSPLPCTHESCALRGCVSS